MGASRNDITCDVIASKPGTREDMKRYEESWVRTFGKKYVSRDGGTTWDRVTAAPRADTIDREYVDGDVMRYVLKG